MRCLILAIAIALSGTPSFAQAPDKMAWNWTTVPKHMATFLAEGFAVVGFHSETTPDGFQRFFYLQKGPALVQCSQLVINRTSMTNCGQLAAPK